MASLIKNQILKHLSKFAKNLSSDKINVSTLKGEGELHNLELNEAVLEDLLELPTWLKLKKAVCNRVNIKIQWTKLKSVPLYVNLDEVLVEMETCDNLRQAATNSTRPSYSSGGKYGFSDQVIDGMTVAINSVEINFKSVAFHASFQLTRLKLESRNPNWHRSDLRMTRLKDPDRGEVLIFKELEWQTLRMEATDPSAAFAAPLRLITNQTRCRITIKKTLSTCEIVASRLVVIFDDLLWVLTDTQIQAALHFATSLTSLIRKAAEAEKRIKAAKKLETWSMAHQIRQAQMMQQQQNKGKASQNTVAKVFNMYDIVETSYHVYSNCIDLHFCDDVKPGEGRSGHPLLIDGASLQVILTRLTIDYYPYHFAYGDRKHWLRYNETNNTRAAWEEQLLAVYRQQLVDLIQGEAPAPAHHAGRQQKSPSHGPPTSPQLMEDRRRSSGQSKAAMVTTFLRRLMTSCFVLRLDDFAILQVATSATAKRMPDKFLSCDKGRLMLPANMAAVHAEFTEYYFPGDDNFPIPISSIHAHANPVQVTVDSVTVLWLHAFLLSLKKSQERFGSSLQDVLRPVDIRLEALMPRIVIPATKEYVNQPDRPKSLQVQISRLVVTNCRVGENCARSDLRQCLELFENGALFSSSAFPAAESDLNPLIEAFTSHSMGQDDLDSNSGCDGSWNGATPTPMTPTPAAATAAAGGVPPTPEEVPTALRRDLLWSENKSLWCVQMEPVWVDFCGMESCKNRPSPFVDAVQATVWLAQNFWPPGGVSSSGSTFSVSVSPAPRSPTPATPGGGGGGGGGSVPPSSSDPNTATNSSTHYAYVLAQFKSLVSIQLNHFQYLFLMRAAETMTALAKQLALDAQRVANGPESKVEGETAETAPHDALVVCVAAVLPEVDLSWLVPVKRGFGGETESIGGDLSSSAATTGALDRTASAANLARASSATFSVRESLSDNHLVAAAGPSSERLVASASDYGVSNLSGGSPAANGSVSGMLVPTLAFDEDTAGRVRSSSESLTSITTSVSSVCHTSTSRTIDAAPVNGKTGKMSSRSSRDILDLTADASDSSGFESASASAATEGKLKGHVGTVLMTQKLVGFFATQGPSKSVDMTSLMERAATLDKVPDQLGKTFASGSSAVKKGFSSLKASFDSALLNPKSVSPVTSPNPSDRQSPLPSDSYSADDLETMSMCSDLSDSDQFVLLTSDSTFMDENLLGTGAPDPTTIEVASEMKETESNSDHSAASSFKRQDLMQVVTIRVGVVELVQQATGLDSVLKVQAQYLHSEEHGTMTWEEFQAKFSAGARAWQEEAMSYTLPACDVRIRHQRGPRIKHVYPEAEERGFLEARVQDATLSLLMSSISSLTDLLEDEVIPDPVPMKLIVNNFRLRLQEDRPAANATTPVPNPINVDVRDVLVRRTPDGAIHLGPHLEGLRRPTPPLADTAEAAVQTGPAAPRTRSRAGSCDSNTSEPPRSPAWPRRPSLDDLDEKVYQLQEENEQLRLKVIALETAQAALAARDGWSASSSIDRDTLGRRRSVEGELDD